MSVKVATWNVRNGLGDHAEYKYAIENIKSLDADVVVLPEAYAEDDEYSDTMEESKFLLEQIGYTVLAARYKDADGRLDTHGLIVASRLEIESSAKVRMLPRIGYRIKVEDPGTKTPLMIYGAHFDDRKESTRLGQAHRIIEAHNGKRYMDDQSGEASPMVLAGDLNSVYPKSPLALALRASRVVTTFLPKVNPGENAPNLRRLRRVASLGYRAGGMAAGHTISYLTKEAGLIDADPNRTPTKGFMQLDHILHTPNLGSGAFKVHGRATSDHHPISTKIYT